MFVEGGPKNEGANFVAPSSERELNVFNSRDAGEALPDIKYLQTTLGVMEDSTTRKLLELIQGSLINHSAGNENRVPKDVIDRLAALSKAAGAIQQELRNVANDLNIINPTPSNPDSDTPNGKW